MLASAKEMLIQSDQLRQAGKSLKKKKKMIKYKQQMGQMAVKVPFFNLSSSSLAHDYSSSASLIQLFQVSLYHRG